MLFCPSGTEFATSSSMKKIKRSDLIKNTKDELIAFGRSLKNLRLKASETKDAIIGKILDAIEEEDKKVASKSPAPKKAAAPKDGVVAKGNKEEKPAKSAEKAQAKSPAKSAEKAPAKAPAKAAPKTKSANGAASAPRGAAAPSAKEAKRSVKGAATRLPHFVASDEEMVTESKYHVAAGQGPLESAALRDRYEDNRIFLQPRDPHWAHSFWDLAPWKPEEVARRHGLDLARFGFALRVYDVTDVEFDGLNAHRFFNIGVSGLKSSWYVNVPEDGRAYLVEIGLTDGNGAFYMMARSNAVMMPRASVSTRTDEEWMAPDEEFWRMYALSGGFKVLRGGGSDELIKQMQRRMAGETSSGAVSSFGGSIMARPKAAEKFWFRLDCELVVYGATEPDAKVTLMGRDMPLRPDGTFSARFALPDGLQALEARAVSASGTFEKTITPTVTRSTAVFQNRELEKKEEE